MAVAHEERFLAVAVRACEKLIEDVDAGHALPGGREAVEALRAELVEQLEAKEREES